MLFAPLAALAATILSAAGAEAADWKADKAASSVSLLAAPGSASMLARARVDLSALTAICLTFLAAFPSIVQPLIVKGKYIVEYASDASRKRGVVRCSLVGCASSELVELTGLAHLHFIALQDVHTHFDSHMRRADVPYEVKSTFDAAGLFVGASIAYVADRSKRQPERVCS